MDIALRRLPPHLGLASPGRPDWLGDFRDWLGRVSPATLADLIDALASELDARNLGDLDLAQAAGRVRAHQAARVRELVDAFLLAPPAGSRSAGPARQRVASA